MGAQPSRNSGAGKPVVVTGGAGFLGGAVTRDLRSLGAEVRTVRSAEFDLRDPAPRAARSTARSWSSTWRRTSEALATTAAIRRRSSTTTS